MKETLIIRGRQITPDDLTFIQSLIKEHWQKGRKFISQELCRHWQWYQPNGNLKDMAARELLLRLPTQWLRFQFSKSYLHLPKTVRPLQ